MINIEEVKQLLDPEFCECDNNFHDDDFPDIVYFHKIHKMFAMGSMTLPELSHSDFVTLITIEKLAKISGDRKVKVSAIVKFLEAPNAAVSRTLKKLEAKELVLRTIDKIDRRNIYVNLTDDGYKILKNCRDNMKAFFNRVEIKFGKEKSDQFRKLMDEFAVIWKEELRKEIEKNK